MINTFAETGLEDDLLKGLAALGFTEPTPIQAEVIPLMLARQVDLVSLAQTGTGKTAAFGLPLIQLADRQNSQTQSLILCPTRELCVQVTRDLEALGRHVAGLRILAVYGGTPLDPQIRALRQGVQIIVATPGRLHDLIKRGKVDISAVRHVVFDEADEMLQMGFQEELNGILAQTPAEKNTLLFSATMSSEVAAIAARYMHRPVEITMGRRNAGADNVCHEYYMVHPRDRYAALKRIVDHNPGNYSIIFCRTRFETNDVAGRLIKDGYSAEALHGELTQAQRDQVMEKFRAKNLQLLVATDVAARGLDVNDLTHVINYNLPDDIANYTHRSGRTGRAGRAGTSLSIIQARELFRIRAIEQKIEKKFKKCSVPSGATICQKQLESLVDGIAGVEVDHEQIDPLYAAIAEKFVDLDREELIKKFISVEFNRFLTSYKNAPDLNVSTGTQRPVAQKKGAWPRPGTGPHGRQPEEFTRFFLNIGRRQGLMTQGLMGKINDIPGVGRIKVGKIDIMRNNAVLEADSRFVPQILDAFQHATINGNTVAIEVAGKGQPRRHARAAKVRRQGAGHKAV